MPVTAVMSPEPPAPPSRALPPQRGAEQPAPCAVGQSGAVPENGGPAGPEPTRFGDWERAGRCIDF